MNKTAGKFTKIGTKLNNMSDWHKTKDVPSATSQSSAKEKYINKQILSILNQHLQKFTILASKHIPAHLNILQSNLSVCQILNCLPELQKS
jgi:hypothetical protein